MKYELEFKIIVDCSLDSFGSYSSNFVTFDIKFFSLPFLATKKDIKKMSRSANELAITAIVSPKTIGKQTNRKTPPIIRKTKVANSSHSSYIRYFYTRT